MHQHQRPTTSKHAPANPLPFKRHDMPDCLGINVRNEGCGSLTCFISVNSPSGFMTLPASSTCLSAFVDFQKCRT
jgi:hypothetical protein